jgi:hypothetical protein
MAAPIPAQPGKKNRRVMYAVAGGAVLALIFLMMRQQGGAAAAPADPTLATDSGIPPTTFADNGAQAAALGDQIGSALSQQSQTIADSLANFQSPDTTGTDPVAQELLALGPLIASIATAIKPAQPPAKTGGAGSKKKAPTKKAPPKKPPKPKSVKDLRSKHYHAPKKRR